MVVKADKWIRNFVWNGIFAEPTAPVAGWVQKVEAEHKLKDGGIAIPDLESELIAMSACMVGDWGLTSDKMAQQVGAILQQRGGGDGEELVFNCVTPKSRLMKWAWSTGRPWVEQWMAGSERQAKMSKAEARKVRDKMRPRHGLIRRWTGQGFAITYTGSLQEELRQARTSRRKRHGECMTAELGQLQLGIIWLWDDSGDEHKWGRYRSVVNRPRQMRLHEVLTLEEGEDGHVLFRPVNRDIGKWGRKAELFGEMCINLIANYPEIMGNHRPEQLVSVHHTLNDPHHVSELINGNLVHTWASERTVITCRTPDFSIERTAALILNTEAKQVWVPPHPGLNKMRVLWAGHRRWKQVRKVYKSEINARIDSEARKAVKAIQTKWRQKNGEMARALDKLEWAMVHKIEGATPYQSQNVYRLKCDRLRLWAGEEMKFRCTEHACRQSTTSGTFHLVWDCGGAKEHWRMFGQEWGIIPDLGDDVLTTAREDIFAFRLERTPRWLIQWASQEHMEQWDIIHEVASDMWRLGCAVVITALWRWRVDCKYDETKTDHTTRNQVQRCRRQVLEAMTRFRMGLYPLTRKSSQRLQVANAVMRRWSDVHRWEPKGLTQEYIYVGMFDGGSRGNPGPGGSGSWVGRLGECGQQDSLVWAAATALGHHDTTNNVAEFIGLQRLLAKAVERGWNGLHVVGDSALILGMMRDRRQPKLRKLQHWYRVSRRLADLSDVASWSHHYRKHNKAADWLANWAMDLKSSRTWIEDDMREHWQPEGIAELMAVDMRRWREGPTTEEKIAREPRVVENNQVVA